MTHLELENLISQYLEGQLVPSRRLEFEEHLAGCQDCRESLVDVRHVMDLVGAAEDLEPSPWLVPRIIAATVGNQVPSFWEEMRDLFRLVFQPKVAYGIAMAVFSLSVIVNATGVNLRRLTAEDLKPSTWIHRVDRNSHLVLARAEKYYYGLKVVYEIESRFRELRPQPGENEPAPEPRSKPQVAPPGGSSNEQPAPDRSQQASVGTFVTLAAEVVKRNSEEAVASGRILFQ